MSGKKPGQADQVCRANNAEVCALTKRVHSEGQRGHHQACEVVYE